MTDIYSYQSSKIDWCEDNYVYSPYIAEFFNTISNLPVLFLAYNHLKARNNLNCFIKPAVLWLFFCIPIASFYFHMTLSFLGQILDELVIMLFMLSLVSNDIKIIIIIAITASTLYQAPEFNRVILLLQTIDVIYQMYHPKLHWPLIWFAIAGICWGADLFFCNSLPFSLHWLWHLFSGLGLSQTLVYLRELQWKEAKLNFFEILI